jgi:hypothetical protein
MRTIELSAISAHWVQLFRLSRMMDYLLSPNIEVIPEISAYR